MVFLEGFHQTSLMSLKSAKTHNAHKPSRSAEPQQNSPKFMIAGKSEEEVC